MARRDADVNQRGSQRYAIHFPPVDEPPRRVVVQQQQREEKQQPKSVSAGVVSSGDTSSAGGVGDAMEIVKTSSGAFGGSDVDREADEDVKESNIATGATMDIASSTSSGEKAKRLVVPHHCGWKYLTKKKSKNYLVKSNIIPNYQTPSHNHIFHS